MVITSSRSFPMTSRRLETADTVTLSSGNQVDAGDRLIISGIGAGLSAIPAVGTLVDLGMAWGARKDGDKLSAAAFLTGGLFNSVGTASFFIGKSLGSETAANVGLAMMLGAAPIAGAVGTWNAF